MDSLLLGKVEPLAVAAGLEPNMFNALTEQVNEVFGRWLMKLIA